MSRPAVLAFDALIVGVALVTVGSHALPVAIDFALWAWREQWNKSSNTGARS